MLGLFTGLITLTLLEFEQNVLNSLELKHSLLAVVVEFQLCALLGYTV